MYEDYEALKFERLGKVLTVTMDNPPLNAASPRLHDELSYVFYDIARDAECSVVVLTGARRDMNMMLRRQVEGRHRGPPGYGDVDRVLSRP